jgi:hypothetical protein
MSTWRHAPAKVLCWAVVSAFVLASLAASPATAKSTPGCAPADAPKVVDVTQDVSHDLDVARGLVWALSSDHRRIQIWRVGENHYCVQRDFEGTFETFAGTSPNRTGTVSAGVTGAVSGVDYAVFSGEFAPQAPTSGYIGAVDFGCTSTGTCANRVGVGVLFFANGFQSIHLDWGRFEYDGGSHGTFTIQAGRNGTQAITTGDITG